MRSLVRALLLALVLLVTPVAFTAAGAAAGAGELNTRTVIRITRSNATYGQRFDVIGQVQGYGTDGWGYLPATSGTIYLERRLAGQTAYQVVGSRVTGDGRVSFTGVIAVRNSLYRLRYSGGNYSSGGQTYHFKATTGDARLLRVHRQLNDRSIVRHGRLYLWGDVNPGWAHRYLRFERKTCWRCQWRRYRLVKANARGRFLARVAPPRRGTWRYRVVIPATLPYSRTISGVYLAHRG